MALRPLDGIGIRPLAGEEQGAEAAEGVFLDVFAVGVLLLDGAKGGRRREQRRHLVLGDDSPEDAGIGGADRLALEEDGGAAVKQRRIDDVGMTHHPADVRRRPVDLARIDTVDVLHRPFERHRVAAVVADDPLGHAGGARGIENIKRIGRRDRHAIGGLGGCHDLVPVDVAALDHRRLGHRALHHDRDPGLVIREIDGGVQERLIFDDPARLYAARGGDDADRTGVVDTGGKLGGGEAAENHRVHRPDAGAGKHGNDRFRYHRHVDQHGIALSDAERLETAGAPGNAVTKFGVGEALDPTGDRAVVDQRLLVAASAIRVAVKRVVTSVEFGSLEPAVEGRIGGIENLVPLPVPVDPRRRLGPKARRVLHRPAVGFLKSSGHRAVS